MADITNEQVKRFCNERVRILADLIQSCRRTCEQIAIEFPGSFEAFVSENANGDVILDGALTDGRSIITKGDVLGLKFVAEKIAEAANLDDREALVAKVAVNGEPKF